MLPTHPFFTLNELDVEDTEPESCIDLSDTIKGIGVEID